MLTQNKNPKVSYLGRLLALPLAAIIFFAFTVKMKTIHSSASYDGKQITVVIDAGHGGSDNGAMSVNGSLEKNINLSIAKEIAGLNSNKHITILLSRSNDNSISVQDRVQFAKANNADLFISIHVNSADQDHLNQKGFFVLIDKNNESPKNKLLASALIEELKKSYTTENTIALRQNNIYVIDKNICTAALVECGYLTNPADEAFITKEKNQGKIAKDILNGIEKYASDINNDAVHAVEIKALNNKVFSDTIPEMFYNNKRVKDITVVEQSSGISVTYTDGSKETITQQEAKKRGFLLPPPPPPVPAIAPVPPTPATPSVAPVPPPPPPILSERFKNNDREGTSGVFVDTHNKIVLHYNKLIYTTDPENSRVNPMKAVIIINGKIEPNNILKTKTINIGTLTIHSGDEENMIAKYGETAKNGVFILDDAIVKDIPPVYPEEKSTKESDKVFTKVENEAEFPGGRPAWIKYIVTKITAVQDSLTEKDFGTCVVKFIVDKDGSVTNVEATTMKDTRLATISVNAIKTGPNWIPATQNNHIVASYRLQPVTLTDPDKK